MELGVINQCQKHKYQVYKTLRLNEEIANSTKALIYWIILEFCQSYSRIHVYHLIAQCSAVIRVHSWN